MSAPAIYLPAKKVTNDELLARVRAEYRGDDWADLERRIRWVFRLCESKERFLEEVNPTPLAIHGETVARRCMEAQGLDSHQIDFVMYGSIAREYYEPSTASEIAARLGLQRAMVMDVTSACAGGLMAIQTACGHLAVQPQLQQGLVCNVAMSHGHLSYDIQDVADAEQRVAGLTIGNAATAVVVSRTPTPGCGRIRGVLSEGLPQYHDLCKVPIGGTFRSLGVEIFGLSLETVPDHIRRLLAQVGWQVADVDYFLVHQPSNRLLRQIGKSLGVDMSRVPMVHHLYGNTESCAATLTMGHLMQSTPLRSGTRMVLVSAAGGFVMASLAIEWL